MSGSQVYCEQITNPDHPLRAGFIDVYREAFGRAPYFETYDDEEIIRVWDNHLAGGCVFMATADGVPAGLACAHKASNDVEASVQEWLHTKRDICPFDPDRTTFMSELAVLQRFEGNGIGTRLLLERLRWGLQQGHVHAAMRTADKGSNSARLYHRYGAVEAEMLLQPIPNPAGDSHSRARTYYWGDISVMIDRIERHL